MKLITKFNLIVFCIFSIGLAAGSWYFHQLIQKNALAQISDQAELLMQEALAVRSYTVKEVRPKINAINDGSFHPQTVPAYAATQISNIIRESRPEYSYKEAVLNPTNPRDLADPWEKKLIQEFISNPGLKKLSGSRETASGQSFYISYPIKITNPACLACHSTPDQAPPSMIEIYGDKAGFGWQLNEIVGVQLVSVPNKLPAELAQKTFINFVISLTLIFVMLFIALNLLIRRLIIKPVTEMTRLAENLSKGDTRIEELKVNSNDEIAQLSMSFNRMRRSVIKIMQMLKNKNSN